MTRRDESGRFIYRTWLFSCPKKSGKSAVAGWLALWLAVVEGRSGEVLFCANDLEQSQSRAFKVARYSIEANPRIAASLTQFAVRLTHTGTVLQALASDYASAAGANPTATIWDELWAYRSENSRRLYDELTPVPTRHNSIRLIVTYAGFHGESELLEELYRTGLAGERLDDDLPIYRNGDLFMYWDHLARMPWHTSEYLASQEAALRPDAYARLFRNEFQAPMGEAVAAGQWDMCRGPVPPLRPGDRTPLVLSVDASVKHDHFACLAVSRSAEHPDREVWIRAVKSWVPGGKELSFYGPGSPDEWLRGFCHDFNVVQLTADPYQLVGLMQELRRDGVVWAEPFPQGVDRLRADGLLLSLIAERRVRYDPSLPGADLLRDHILNAGYHVTGESEHGRLVKLTYGKKIDLAVCAAMAVDRCLYLNLETTSPLMPVAERRI